MSLKLFSHYHTDIVLLITIMSDYLVKQKNSVAKNAHLFQKKMQLETEVGQKKEKTMHLLVHS